ncbi:MULTISPECIES: SDR family oxidoreductase [Pseudomonas]|uniref:Short-chain dehydrogenase/reductase n=3 Tax=Pseudomonas syringae group TaxID=136849 RepID=A0A3M4IS21_PSEVI|nr:MULTISPECIES: SDR family oxidoreductase [Pseudomonas]KTB71324.1 oxidoreductase [Pseudomonas sp. ICMP 3272]KTC53385.1 oxidoreductase [Pseudomonas syringae ICMP 19498]RMP00546.1 Short-chain dehydrogenase/reductase [Pseudomonas syringae pv. persicae]RMQ07597.1 Short-chain dehydrogenase/reductase [Pseudomonas viridiflava]RMQ78460.1 Short-chain dehydrogenase/reductase [Pseudomonas viridiflava]
MKLNGNTILITGGATGIGFSLAKRLAENNDVIICGRNEAMLDRAKNDVSTLITHACDVTDTDSRRALVRWLKGNHPSLNVVINNAGVQHQRDFNSDPNMDTLDTEVAVNFTAPVHLIAELLPSLKQQEKAYIINVSSGLAFSPMADVPVYCATKAAIHSFTLSLRHQLKSSNIRVIEIAPPLVDTGLGGGTRSAGTARQMMVSADDFANETIEQLVAGKDEILVGVSVKTRQMGDAMFEIMNKRE